MRFALVSDLHANLQAWRAVAADLEAVGVDQVVCLGDIVGYGPNPVEVLEEVVARADHIVLGNHDAVIGGRFDSSCFSDQARAAIEWTQRRLNTAASEFFQGVPAVLRGPGFAVSHAEYELPERFDYIFEPAEALPSFRAVNDPVLFFGHTHLPGVFRFDPEDGHVDLLPAGRTVFNPAYRYLINTGSVGDPRDGDVRASYAIFDADERWVDFRKVAFDIPAYQSALRRSRLPTQPLFFQFLQPAADASPAAPQRTRAFHAGEEQVRQAAAAGQRTVLLDTSRRTVRIRAAGSGNFARRGMTPQRKKQVGITLGVAAAVFLVAAGVLFRGFLRRPPPPATLAAAGGIPAPEVSLREGLRAFYPLDEEGQLARLLSVQTGGAEGELSGAARRGAGVQGGGLDLPDGEARLRLPLPAAEKGEQALSWWSRPGAPTGEILRLGPEWALTWADGELELSAPAGRTRWGPLPAAPTDFVPWRRLTLAGASFTWSAWVRLDAPGVLYAEAETGSTPGFRIERTATHFRLRRGEQQVGAAVALPAANLWQHLALVHDYPQGRLGFWVDGQLVHTASFNLAGAPDPAPAGPWLGGAPGETSARGALDEWVLLRTALPEDRVPGLAAGPLAPSLRDSPALLVHGEFEGGANLAAHNPAGLGFRLESEAPETAPGRPGRALALSGTPLALSPGFLLPAEDPGSAQLPRPSGWRHFLLSFSHDPQGAPITRLWCDGLALVPRGEAAPAIPPVGSAAEWRGVQALDEIALFSRALRDADARALAGRTYAWRSGHPLGRYLLQDGLRREDSTLAGLTLQVTSVAPAALADLQRDLQDLAARVRGSPLWIRVEAKRLAAQERAVTERARLLEGLERNAKALADKGQPDQAANLLAAYAGPFAPELAEARAQLAESYRTQAARAQAEARHRAETFFKDAWPRAARSLLASDWAALRALAAEAETSGPTDDTRFLRLLGNTPSRAGEALAAAEGQNLALHVEGQRESMFQIETVNEGRIFAIRIDADAAGRRQVIPLEKLALRSLAARLDRGPALENAAPRAAAYASLGRLDRAIEELQGLDHPFAAALREAILQTSPSPRP
jgi:predicted phosphodiesterase